MAVGLDLQDSLHEPHALDRLAEAGRGLPGHAGADGRHPLQLRAADRIGAGGCLLGGKAGVTLRPAVHGVEDDKDGGVEDVLVQGVGVGEVEGCLGGAGALGVAAQAPAQEARVVDGQVGIAGVELALHAKEARLHKYVNLMGQERTALLAQGPALPEGGDGAELGLCLLGDVEDVAVAQLEGVQLVDHEAHGVLGEDGRVHVLAGLVAGQEGLVLYVDGHVVEDLLEHAGATHDGRLGQVLAVGLGGKERTLGLHVGNLVEHLLAEGGHAGREGAKVLGVLHGDGLLLGRS